jgi:hypothetical protein
VRPNDDAEVAAADLLVVEPAHEKTVFREIETLASDIGNTLRLCRPAATGEDEDHGEQDNVSHHLLK